MFCTAAISLAERISGGGDLGGGDCILEHRTCGATEEPRGDVSK